MSFNLVDRVPRVAFSIVLVLLSACGKHGNTSGPVAEKAASPGAKSAQAPSAPSRGSDTPSWSGHVLSGNDPEALHHYIATAKEIVPTTFKVQWNPATVAFSKDAAMRSLRAVSFDGQRFTLDPADPQTAKLVPGSILWIYDITVSKVDRVEHRGGSVVVYTSPVPLNEALPEADIRFEAAVPASNFVVGRRLPTNEPAETPVPAGGPVAKLYRRAPESAPIVPGYLVPVLYNSSATGIASQLPLMAANPPPPAEPAPPSNDAAADAADDEAVAEEEDALTNNTYRKTYKGYDIELAYAPLPLHGDAIGLRIKAKKALDTADTGNGSAEAGAAAKQAVDDEAKAAAELADKLKAVRAEEKALTAEIRGLRAKLYESQLTRADPMTIQAQQKDLDAALVRKAALAQKHDALKQLRQDQQQKAWEQASDIFDVRFMSQIDMKGFSTAGRFLFSKGNVEESSVALKQIDAHAVVAITTRLGDKGVKGTKVPVMHIPVSFNVPVPIAGIPFSMQIGADFSLNVFLSGQHAMLSLTGDYSFNGKAGVTASSTGAQYDDGIAGDPPKITTYQGMTPGASAFVLAIQLPRIGFGLGLLGASSMAVYDVVSVLSMTSAAEAVIGLAPACKRITYKTTSRVGIETKMMPLPIPLLKQIEDKLTTPKHILYEKEHVVLAPKIKGCQIN